MKSRRQNKIIELIGKYEIETQEELLGKLLAQGYNTSDASYDFQRYS